MPGDGTGGGDRSQREGRVHRRVRLRWVLAAAAGVWLVAVAGLLLLARHDGLSGFTHLDRARRSPDLGALLEPGTAQELHESAAAFDRSQGWLDNPLLAPLRVVPFVGRQLRASQRLDRAAASSVAVAAGTVDDLRVLTQGPTPHGPHRVELVRAVGRLAERADHSLSTVDAGSGDALIGPLDRAHRTFVQKRTDSRRGLTRTERLTAGLADFLQGPSHYLLVGANNAEMRAGSGMWLSAGPLDASAGRLDLGDVRPTDDLVLAAGAVPVTDPDLARNWSWLDPGRDFRQLALTPRFEVTAGLAQRMWALVPGGSPVDGVVMIDVEGLRDVLRAVGPVTVDGTAYRPDNLQAQLLNQQYREPGGQRVRKDRLGAVARAAFDRLERGSWRPEALVTQLGRAGAGRHLMVWSSRVADQAAWEAASVDGSVQDRSFAVSLLNRGANKLDFFLGQSVEVRTQPSGSDTDVTVRVKLTNRTPAGQPSYVAGGPQASAGLVPGEYGGILVVNLPAAAGDVILDGGAYSTLAGRDGPSQARGIFLRLPAGRATEVTVRFRLTGRHGSLVLEPTGRAPEAIWSFQGLRFKAELRRTVRW